MTAPTPERRVGEGYQPLNGGYSAKPQTSGPSTLPAPPKGGTGVTATAGPVTGEAISAAHLEALARYARDEISTGRLAELLGVSLMDLLDLRNAVQRDDYEALSTQRALREHWEAIADLQGEEVSRLTAEVERLKWEAVVWKSSLECWGRHHPWCWMVTQAGVEGVYCNCGYREALMGKDRSHEVAQLSTHDAEQVRLFEERIRATTTPESREAFRCFLEARDTFAALSLPTPAPEATDA